MSALTIVRATTAGYSVSSWHEMADSCARFSHRKLAPGWLFRGIAWLFRRLGAASAHPSAKEYLAPLRMRVGSVHTFREHGSDTSYS